MERATGLEPATSSLGSERARGRRAPTGINQGVTVLAEVLRSEEPGKRDERIRSRTITAGNGALITISTVSSVSAARHTGHLCHRGTARSQPPPTAMCAPCMSGGREQPLVSTQSRDQASSARGRRS